MASLDFPSSNLPRSSSIDELDWIAADQADIEEFLPSSAFSFDANQFDFVDFGTSINQQASLDLLKMPKQPKDSSENIVGDFDNASGFSNFFQQDSTFDQPQPEAEKTVGKFGISDDFTDFFQNDLESLNPEFQLSNESLSNTDFNFDIPMSNDAATQTSSQDEPRYVSFTANQYAYPPPSNPSMEPSNPYAIPQTQYPWAGAPTLEPNYQNNFGAMTPPGAQPSSLHPDMPYYGNMAPRGRKYTPLPISPDGGEYALSPTATFYRKRRPYNHPDASSRMTKKARRATIKNYLHSRSLPSHHEPKDKDSDSSSPTSPPLSPSHDNFVPTNVFNARDMDPHAARQRMEAIKAARRAHFNIPQNTDTTSDSTSAARFYCSEPVRIQGRRKKHPGRKITVAQTPEVIARNAARRERYRMSLAPKQRAAYDAEKPGEVRVGDV